MTVASRVEPGRAEAVLRATDLGKRYRRGWALRGCSLTLPRGRVAALVGPNASGKTTLMKLATGLVTPTEGEVVVLGEEPGRGGAPTGVSFLSQDKPLYPSFRVSEMLRVGAALNPGDRWDAAYAHSLVQEADIPLAATVRSLSGGQRTRVALALALGRRPELLLLDEPLADLDPLARREVMSTLMAEVARTGMTVLMSSHVIADLDGVCDHVLLLRDGRVWLAGDVDDLIAEHHLLTGARGVVDPMLPRDRTVFTRHAHRQTLALVRGPLPDTRRTLVEPVSLEELVLGYLQAPTSTTTTSTTPEVLA